MYLLRNEQKVFMYLTIIAQRNLCSNTQTCIERRGGFVTDLAVESVVNFGQSGFISKKNLTFLVQTYSSYCEIFIIVSVSD